MNADVATEASPPLLEASGVSKRFDGVRALEDVSVAVPAGRVTCLLGDNGAGKSTLVKIVTGVYGADAGEIRMEGEPARFDSPREAIDRGVVPVHQHLAVVPLMSVWRNFWLGAEPTRGRGPLRRIDVGRARRETRESLADVGIEIEDVDRPMATLSGGERQAVAIARALHRGARVLVLDEPTAALGVKQTGIVIDQIERARDRGVGILLVTHAPHDAHPLGDRYVVLRRGRAIAERAREEVGVEELSRLMAGQGGA